METAGDVVRTKTGAYRSLFHDFHWRSQCSGPQQQRHVPRFRRRHAPADLYAAAGDLRTDYWRRDHFTFAFFHQDHRHALADILARNLLEDRRAAAIEINVYRRFSSLAVKTGLRVGDAVSGQDDLALEHVRRSFTVVKEFVTERRLSADRSLQ